MKLISTAQLDEHILEQFFEDKWNHFEQKQTLKQDGYLIEYQDLYKAYFSLSPVGKNAYWLKSLYIKEGVPASFPLAIIESSLALASEKGASSLFVYSHQQSLDSLLSLLNFQSQLTPSFAEEIQVGQGTWWEIDPRHATQLNN
ncbi:hypothetical protein GH741_15140 [Aquibacillus halophilus]|uniref:GNAT family N-acetyltransferase n=1 Tax=Aquibacillus halophilus TaxID=930132 RepID=A0A6A8DLV6_9BACI|nr:hypothetical protein [Aquibacillus halophilus]MRH43977.1 hypothetical protein [Aquibacillus halophilus]